MLIFNSYVSLPEGLLSHKSIINPINPIPQHLSRNHALVRDEITFLGDPEKGGDFLLNPPKKDRTII